MDLLKIDLNIDKYLLGSILCIENVNSLVPVFAWNVNRNVQYFNLQYFFLKRYKDFQMLIFRHFVWIA